MKIAIGVIVVVIIGALLAGGAFLFLSNGGLEGLGIGGGSKITLVRESGKVSYKESETAEYKQLTDEEVSIKNGSFIKTEEDSFARIFLPDNSLISMDVSTEIQVNFEDNKTNVQQLIGKTWNRVQTLTKGGEFKVETPNTVAAVRGTIFGVGVDDDDHSRVFSIEHTINVGKYEDDPSKILEDVDVEDGKIAEVTKEETLEIDLGDVDSEFSGTFWYKRNQIVDEEWKKIKDLTGVDLIDLLKENLQKRSDYQEQRLGLEDVETDINKIKSKLQNVYNLSQIDTQVCVEHSQEEIQTAMDELQLYKQYVVNYDDVYALLYSLKEVCRDGRLSAEDAEFLQTLVDGTNVQ